MVGAARPETLIVGGGLAGGAAALRLARAGASVRLLERAAGPHDKVCGEFLSIEATRDLAALGIDLARLGAVAIDRVRLAADGREVEARLPFVAQGLSRRVLDEALLEAAARAGAAIERGRRVAALAALAPRGAGAILVATGKHALRGASRDPAAATRGGYVGFKLHWRLPAREAERLRGAIELLLFAGGYAGLQLVGPRVANLCLVVRQPLLAALGNGWAPLRAHLFAQPAFARRLGDAEPLFARPLTIANLPYGHVSPPPARDVFLLGDQAAMTASLSGDGMAAALASARLAADCLLAGGDAHAHHARVRAGIAPQVRRAMLLQRATALPWLTRAAMRAFRLRPALLGMVAGATRLPAWREEVDGCA